MRTSISRVTFEALLFMLSISTLLPGKRIQLFYDIGHVRLFHELAVYLHERRHLLAVNVAFLHAHACGEFHFVFQISRYPFRQQHQFGSAHDETGCSGADGDRYFFHTLTSPSIKYTKRALLLNTSPAKETRFSSQCCGGFPDLQASS